MVLDLYFTWRAFIKLDGEGGVALDHRRCGGGGDTLSGIWSVLCGNLLNLRLGFLGRSLREFLCWDLKVARLPAIGEDGLGMTVGQRTIDLISGQVFSGLC